MRFKQIAAQSSRRILREGMWIGVGQVSTVLASLLGVRVLTTLLSPSVYGSASLLLGLVALGNGLFGIPVLQANLRFYPEAIRQGRVSSLRRMTLRALGIGMICVIPCLLAGGAAWVWMKGSGVSFAAFLLAGAFLVADVLRAFEAGMLNAARRQEDYALRNAADALARPTMAIAAIVLFGPSVTSVLTGYFLGSATVSLLLLGRRVLEMDRPGPAGDEAWYETTRRAFLAYAAPLVPLSALNWIMSSSDRYIVAAFADAGAAGIYVVAYTLGSQPFIAVNAVIHSTLRPVLYDAVAAGDAAKERRTLRSWLGLVLIVSTTGFLLILVASPLIARLLLGPGFRAAAGLLPWIAAAYALQNVQQTFEVMMYAHGQTRRLVALQVLAAVSGITLYAILIPRFGALGAAMGTLGSLAVTCCTSAVLANAPARLRARAPAPAVDPGRRPEITL